MEFFEKKRKKKVLRLAHKYGFRARPPIETHSFAGFKTALVFARGWFKFALMNNPRDLALKRLIRLLQDAHAGELAAFHAYDGHFKSVKDPKERQEIKKIRDEEWEHRECLARFLSEIGAAPRPAREFLMKGVGLTIGFLCRIGGWLIPMYGAGKLESGNIVEYEIAARLAFAAGRPEWISPLLHMAEVEWDHEIYFRQKLLSHRWGRFLPVWPLPPPRAEIRAKGPQALS